MLKVAVIGGGSTYTPELVNGFIARVALLPLDELWLMDIDKEQLEIVGGFAQRMVEAKGSPFKVILTVVNIKNGGTVKVWPCEWVLEMPSTVKKSGIAPIPTEPLPPAQFGLIAAVKAYEILTVEAAVHGDREAAYQALLAHPIGPKADKIQVVLDDLRETHKEHLPQFWN